MLWPAPPNPLELARKAGLVPEKKESFDHHVHAHLDVFVDGRPVVVPAGLGINITDPGVRSGGTGLGKSYGGISGCGQPCISPLHTHDASGIVHTESASATPNTLGELFTEWGLTLSAQCVSTHCGGVKAYVNGKEAAGDPGAIELLDHEEIAVVVGTPPSSIPSKGDFSQA